MKIWKKAILISTALYVGGFFALGELKFTDAVEVEGIDTLAVLFSIFLGTAISLPCWLPALLPRRLIIRHFCGVGLLLLTMLFGSIVYHNITRQLNGMGWTPSALVEGLIGTTLLSLAAWFVFNKDGKDSPNTPLEPTR